MVDGGGVCRDKYLPVNTERLALPSRSIPSPQTTCISKRTFDGWTGELGRKGAEERDGTSRTEPNES